MCPQWADPDKSRSEVVPPWDHLRENRYPSNTYLNKLKIDDYRRIVESLTNVVKEEKVEFGRDVLTDELEAELAAKGYTQEDLLTGVVVFAVRKKR